MLKLTNEKGISLIEVLASVVLISIIFSLVSSYILSSAQYTKSISNKYSAVQLAESLLNAHREMEFSSLLTKNGKTEALDIQNTLKLREPIDGDFKATLTVAKHSDPKLKDRLLLMTVKVYSTENGVQKETMIEGYKRK